MDVNFLIFLAISTDALNESCLPRGRRVLDVFVDKLSPSGDWVARRLVIYRAKMLICSESDSADAEDEVTQIFVNMKGESKFVSLELL